MSSKLQYIASSTGKEEEAKHSDLSCSTLQWPTATEGMREEFNISEWEDYNGAFPKLESLTD